MVEALLAKKETDDTDERLSHLDVVRTACILVWVVRHGDSNFNKENIILDQHWAAPLLWVICGICWGRSRTSLWTYVQRLAFIFCVGTALNAFAWHIQNPAEHLNFDLWNIVFQMWFVVGLILMVCITAPLKAISDLNVDGKGAAILWSAAYPFVFACAASILYLAPLSKVAIQVPGLQWWFNGGMNVACLPLAECALAQVMAAYTFVFPPEYSHGVVGWIYLAFVLGAPVVFQHHRVGLELGAMHLFILGVIVQRQGLLGRSSIRRVIIGYWPIFLVFCGCLAIPLTHRSELEPSEYMSIRARWSALTFTLVAAFLCAGDVIRDRHKLFTRFPGLRYWALFLYISHIAVHRLVPSPFNWWLLVSSVVPFLFMTDQYDRATPDEAKRICATGSQLSSSESPA